MKNSRIFIFKGILWSFVGLATAVAVIRFTLGLGVSTALSDTTPWGLWIGFDVMGGVALAAGGFVIAAVVHIFHREKYHAAARPAILTAFLGYGAVAVGLLFDLGLPWHIWHPVIFWNIYSPLFEVAWCVMLYLTVLGLEVAPTILERTSSRRTYRFLTRLSLPIMILGIMLSTLHQSSLGSLLLIMPFRIHPLWYSHWLPELFFVSAICLGLNMVMFESSITSWLYRRRPETDMLDGLTKMAAWGLAFYLVLRGADLATQHKLGFILAGTWESNFFILEMLMSTIAPIALYAVPKVRRSPTGVWLVSSTSVLGFVLNRINAAGLAHVWATRVFYFPAWTEFAISIGIVSACGLVFFFIQEHCPVDPHTLEKLETDREVLAKALPRFAPFTQVWLGEGWQKAAKVYSMLFILALAWGLTVTPKSEPFVTLRAQRARGGDILRVGFREPYVYFDHRPHQDEARQEGSCGLCHHLHKAGDVGTPCSECHRAMYTATNTFDHDAHVAAMEGNRSCVKCHGEENPLQVKATKTCQDCHRDDMMAANPVVKKFESEWAGSYKDAMHKMCIPCHVKTAADPTVKRPDLGRCGACHNEGTKSERTYRATIQPRKTGEGSL
jgi:Ni/Fe-hydrogenase subunit HybB-like protein